VTLITLSYSRITETCTVFILGYIAAILIGISLGLLGGGGSILTVPVLVYLFSIDPVTATGYSLFIVGITAFTGAIGKWRSGFVAFRTALYFGIPSMLMVLLSRSFIVPFIPDMIIKSDHFILSKGSFLMLIFALLMLMASRSMIKGRKNIEEDDSFNPAPKWKVSLYGAGEGLLTGLVGAGGGFIIIPALVLFCRLPMKTAVGTSLLIIGVKSLVGFTGDLSQYAMNWPLLLIVSGLALVGMFFGNQLTKHIDGPKLRTGFGWFVLIMAVLVICLTLKLVNQ